MLFRWFFGLPGAALVTALLFIGMAALIKQDAELKAAQPAEISILPKIKESEPKPKLPVRPTQPEPPKPVDIEPTQRIDNPGGLDPIDITPGPSSVGPGPILPGQLRPVFKSAPQYPENCRSRGAQGVVIVEFDVTPEGTVVNPRIVASADSCLDRTVLRTIASYRYPPTVEDGRPVMRRGVQEVFNFQLTD